MEELLAAVAEAMDAPASMVQRSAEARAKAQGASVEDVLRAWSGGGEISAAPAPAAPAAEDPAPAAPAAGGAPDTTVAPAAMDEASIVAAAAAKMGMPESMVTRSAAARAKAQGIDADTVLREWAGIEAGAAAPAATPAPAAATAPDAPASAAPAPTDPAAPAAPAPAPAPAAPATPTAPAPAAIAAAATEVEVLGTPEPRQPVAPAAPVDPLESVEEAVAAGAFPRWLAALFVLIPAFALGYALFLPNGPNCGDAGSLAVDPVSGLAVNCDGSAFGSATIDLFALGAETYQGVGCLACHGAGGGGVASFPAFTGGVLLSTFPEGSCSAQVEWIALGTAGWPDATYGATNKPVGGSGAVMPGFAGTLSPQEIAAVSLYERVEFGGQDLDAAIADCTSTADTEAAALGE